jgi:hypothetical protein
MSPLDRRELLRGAAGALAAGTLAETAAALRSGEAPAASGPAPAKPAATGGWTVDADSFGDFVNAIHRVRDRLRDVRRLVDAMRSGAYTPKLGTSPVARQLEQKFVDRLDTPLDNPQNPTGGGLRPMLAESMRRMEEFLAGAEAAAQSYREHDQSAAQHLGTGG